jgi:ATP-dependent DNA helicase RecG
MVYCGAVTRRIASARTPDLRVSRPLATVCLMDEHESPLTLSERVRATLELGESHFREFKSAQEGAPVQKQPRNPKLVRRDIGEALVAFANADGGELLVGVEDDGTVPGVPHKEEVVQTFLDAWRTHIHDKTPIRKPRVARIELDGQLVLYFSVEKSTEYVHLTNEGRCLQRRDRESIPVPGEQIHFERKERISREYDRAFIDGGDPSVLDLDIIERIGDEIAPGLSPEKVLQLLDLAEFSGSGVRLRRAAVLLLAKEITHWHPRCEVRILRVSGSELGTGREYNVVHDRHVVGSILELLTKAWEEIRPFLVETRLGPDGRFEEQVRYPEDACREALTNAIAHRDYSIEGRAIEVYVFDDRLEVRSPGALLSTVTIEGLRSFQGVHQSRNTIVARTLRELGYMREMGEGFRRIFQLMRAHDLVEPELVADDQAFVVSLRHQSVFSEEDQRWIGAYEQFDLARDEEKVLLLGRDGAPLSVQQIMDALDLVDTEDYRELIARLQEKGLIESLKKVRSQTRNSPRWKVIQPKDANIHYSELLAAARAVYYGGPLDKRDYAHIAEHVSSDSPYVITSRLQFTFRRLGLINELGEPSGRLKLILDARNPPKSPVRRSEGRARLEGQVKPETSPLGVKSAEDVLPVLDSGEAAEVGLLVAQREPTKIYVGNLSYRTVKNDVQELFGTVGTVRRVSLPQDYQRAGFNQGYGFVEMATARDAKRAKETLEGARLDGRPIRLEWAKS